MCEEEINPVIDAVDLLSMLAGVLFSDQKIPDIFREPDPLIVQSNLASLFYFYGSSVYQPYFQASAAKVIKRDYYLNAITVRLNEYKLSFRLLKVRKIEHILICECGQPYFLDEKLYLNLKGFRGEFFEKMNLLSF